jgi:hypothetical protein
MSSLLYVASSHNQYLPEAGQLFPYKTQVSWQRLLGAASDFWKAIFGIHKQQPSRNMVRVRVKVRVRVRVGVRVRKGLGLELGLRLG